MTLPIEGSFSANGVSAVEIISGPANLTIDFNDNSAVIQLQRSFDNVVWHTLSKNIDGHPAEYRWDVSTVFNEIEAGVRYRLMCSEYISGTIDYRVSQ